MTIRDDILDVAKKTVSKSREATYGPPIENFSNCASLWTAYICAKFGGAIVDPLQLQLSAEDVAHLNVLQKMARTMGPKVSTDTYVDMAGYSALAAECHYEEIE